MADTIYKVRVQVLGENGEVLGDADVQTSADLVFFEDGQTFQYSSVQKYLLRNDVVNTGTWKYTTSGYKGDTCFVQGGSVGVKDSLWISASISGGLAYIDPMQAYYYQYLKIVSLALKESLQSEIYRQH